MKEKLSNLLILLWYGLMLWSSQVNCVNKYRELKLKKTVVIVGPSGFGKSTIANCIINQNPSLNLTQSYPYATKNGANGCTTGPVWHHNDEYVVIDTVGFGDPSISSQESFYKFQQALASVNNFVDIVIFLMKGFSTFI
jgi:putative ribosome biogenesis GTPase RsgA